MNTTSVSLDPEVAVRELVSQAEQRITDAEAALAGLAGARELLDRLRDVVAQAQADQHERTERPRLYTVPDAARTLRISESKVVKLLASGELASIKVGAARRITAVALDAYLDRLVLAGAA